jgi:hypothetical protein
MNTQEGQPSGISIELIFHLRAEHSSLNPSSIHLFRSLRVIPRPLASYRQTHSMSTSDICVDATMMHNMFTNFSLKISFNVHTSQNIGQ